MRIRTSCLFAICLALSAPLGRGQVEPPVSSPSAFSGSAAGEERAVEGVGLCWRLAGEFMMQKYACRAGTTTATAFGDSLSREQANFHGEPYGDAKKGRR